MSSKKPAAPSLTYAQWRERARERMAGPSTMRERDWRNLFIRGRPREEAADVANVYYGNSRVRAKRLALLFSSLSMILVNTSARRSSSAMLSAFRTLYGSPLGRTTENRITKIYSHT